MRLRMSNPRPLVGPGSSAPSSRGAREIGQRSTVVSHVRGRSLRFSTWMSHSVASPGNARQYLSRRRYVTPASALRFHQSAAPRMTSMKAPTANKPGPRIRKPKIRSSRGSRDQATARVTSNLDGDRQVGDDVVDEFGREATAQLSLRGDHQAMGEYVRGEGFCIVGQCVIATVNGGPGLARRIQSERRPRTRTKVDFRVGARRTGDGDDVPAHRLIHPNAPPLLHEPGHLLGGRHRLEPLARVARHKAGEDFGLLLWIRIADPQS